MVTPLPMAYATFNDMADSDVETENPSNGEYWVPEDLTSVDSNVSMYSLGDMLCDLWLSVLKLFEAVVEGVSDVVFDVLDGAVHLLSEVLEVAGDALGGVFGSSGSFLMIAAIGIGAYLLLTSDSGEEDPPSTVDGSTPRGGRNE